MLILLIIQNYFIEELLFFKLCNFENNIELSNTDFISLFTMMQKNMKNS